MSLRTLWNLEHSEDPSPDQEVRGRGRPRHSDRAYRKALFAVRREMKKQGKTVGEGSVLAAIGDAVPRVLVRDALARWKEYDRSTKAIEREARRVSIVAKGPGVAWSLDGSWMGRVLGRTARAEIAIDIASRRTVGMVVAYTASAAEVILLLERALVLVGSLPLVIFIDNGPENVNAAVAAWCHAHGVILVRSVPHTPEHNPWIERRNGELKAVSGLDAWVPVDSLDEVEARLQVAVDVLDGGRLRRTLGYVTARVADERGRLRYDADQRRAFYAAACAARTEARTGLGEEATSRDVRRAEREATLGVLEALGLITRTVGGRSRSDALSPANAKRRPRRPRQARSPCLRATASDELGKNEAFPSPTSPTETSPAMPAPIAQPAVPDHLVAVTTTSNEMPLVRAPEPMADAPCAVLGLTPPERGAAPDARQCAPASVPLYAGADTGLSDVRIARQPVLTPVACNAVWTVFFPRGGMLESACDTGIQVAFTMRFEKLRLVRK